MPTPVRRRRLNKIKGILASGAKTLRRVFYMLGHGASYKAVIKDCVWLRLHGELPWSSIVEEGRHLVGYPSYTSLSSFIHSISDQYRLSKAAAFSKHIEVWLEKATLENVFNDILYKYDIDILVTRGDISWTALKTASERLDEDSVVLYFGDNDSYGLKMYKGIQDRLGQLGSHPSFHRIALTDEQEARFKFPKGEHHLDGMPEDELSKLLEPWVKRYLDEELFKQLCDQETEDIARLEKILEES